MSTIHAVRIMRLPHAAELAAVLPLRSRQRPDKKKPRRFEHRGFTCRPGALAMPGRISEEKVAAPQQSEDDMSLLNHGSPEPSSPEPRNGHGTRLIDITGKRFGRWTVLAIHPKRMRYGRRRQAITVLWLCRCDCGTERVVFGTNLRRRLSSSCGCRSREKTRERSTRHGHARRGNVTRAYTLWVCMRQRCFNPNTKCYCYYGGRGITVCERWLKFENFYADMGDPPPGLSLDRINVNSNYELSNCRWATISEQRSNQTSPAFTPAPVIMPGRRAAPASPVSRKSAARR